VHGWLVHAPKNHRIWLVVSTLWKMMELVSWDYMIPQQKGEKCYKPPTSVYIYVYIYLYKYKYIIIPPLNPILTICNHINHSTSSWRPTSPAQRLWPHWRLPVAPSWDFRRFPRRPWAEATGISDGAEFGIPKLMIEWWMGKLVYKAGKVSWASFWGIHRMGWMGYIT
jgi:hypothetical protein